MGWLPRETLACTAWEFWAAWDGYVEANAPPEPESMSRAELDELKRRYGLDG